MHIEIEKNFVKLSTKEWMQYLQYKLSPERERELMDHTQYDEFLRDALESINAMEGRHLAYNSLSYIHSQIEEMTGVSSSKITNQRTTNHYNNPAPSFNLNKILLIALGVAVVIGMAIGIYYYMSSSSEEADLTEESTTESETAIQSNSTIDSSSMPMSTIQNNTATMVDTPMNQTATTTVNNAMVQSAPSKPTESKPKAKPSSNNTPPSSASTNAEKDQFQKAQELYKQGKVSESKDILKKLNSYDNPYKSQSETLLKNLSDQ